MNNLKRLMILMILVLSINILGCGYGDKTLPTDISNKSDDSDQEKTNYNLNSLNDNITLVGTIGNSKIHMLLNYSGYNGTDNNLFGSYYYDKYNSYIYFQGSVNKDKFHLTTTDTHNPEENFEATIDSKGKMVGTWSSGGKNLSLNLQIVSNPDYDNLKLPSFGKTIQDFVPYNWELKDYATSDLNGNGLLDVVGILQNKGDSENYADPEHPKGTNFDYPRILFIAFKTKNGYTLNLQNNYITLTTKDGKMNDDPYRAMTATKSSFALKFASGDSYTEWNDLYTFKLINGLWREASYKSTFAYANSTSDNDYEIAYQLDDYEKGTGVRRYTQEPDDLNGNWGLYPANPKKLEFTVKTGEMPILNKIGEENKLLNNISVNNIIISNGIHISKNDVLSPKNKDSHQDYLNNSYLIYFFKDKTNSDLIYLCQYNFANKNVTVMKEFDTNQNSYNEVIVYKDKLYIVEESSKTVGMPIDSDTLPISFDISRKIVSIDLLTEEEKTLFEQKNSDYHGQTTTDKFPDMFCFYLELCDDEIIAEVYTEQVTTFYRIDLDTGKCKIIGVVPDNSNQSKNQ